MHCLDSGILSSRQLVRLNIIMNTPLTNLADLIRSDCVIHCPNGKIVDSNYIHTLTNVYKAKLYDQLEGKTVGKIGLIWSNKLDVILPCIKAMWQMGCVVSVHDYTEAIAKHPSFKNFYKHIDFVVGTPDSLEIMPHLPHLAAPETELNYLSYINQESELEIYKFQAKDFPDINYQLDQPLSKNSLAVVSHTSGTTGDPRIFGISHDDAIALVQENIKIFNFTDQDRVGHIKTLHHGSLFLNYAIPAFATTKHHYWFLETYKPIFDSKKFLHASVKFCADNSLTKMLVHYPFLSEDNFENIDSIDICNTSLILIVGPEPHLMKKIFDLFNPACVYNNFGCTEIGTIAVSKTTRENLEWYSPRKFSIRNSIVDIESEESYFRVKYKTTTEWKEIGDVIELTDNQLIYHKRNNKIQINNALYDVDEINSFLKSQLKIQKFSLVPDFSNNCLYLAFYSNSEYKNYPLDVLNKKLSESFDDLALISKTSCFVLGSVFNGMKPSQPLLIYAFRNQ
jgi:hypothetical protein